MLSGAGITKRFGAVTALDDVSVRVLPGEVLALAGENGSGKSTLVRCLSGGMRPDAGTVLLDDLPRSYASPREALDDGIAIIAQELTTLPHLSVAENICLPFLRGSALRLFRRPDNRRVAESALARVELDVDPATPLGALSPVQQTMVELAKALATQPRFLILDEVTSRLGSDDVALVEALARQLADEGVAIVVITHRIKEMTRLADRAAVLRDGRNVGELRAPEVTERQLVRLMVGRDVEESLDRAAPADARTVLEVSGLQTDRSPRPQSFRVRAGEIVGLAGLVGSGRSELLEALAGTRQRNEGSVVVGQAVVPAASVASAIGAGVVLVPEDRHRQSLVLDFSITENFVLGKYGPSARVKRACDRRQMVDAASVFGIKTRDVDAPVTTLSGGNQQKVVLARALTRRPRVLLLDEPTRGVDIGARSEIYHLIAEQADAGLAVLVASSDLVELLAICDRVLVMHDGDLVADIPAAQASEELIAHHSMGGGIHVDVA